MLHHLHPGCIIHCFHNEWAEERVSIATPVISVWCFQAPPILKKWATETMNEEIVLFLRTVECRASRWNKGGFPETHCFGANGRDFKRCRCHYSQQKVVLKRSKKNPTVFGIFLLSCRSLDTPIRSRFGWNSGGFAAKLNLSLEKLS